MAQIEYYTTLGVGRQAASEDIKRAYRRLAVQWHPDRNPGSRLAEERFKAIAEAYAVLSHPARRRQYDLLGPAEFKNEFSREDIFQGFEPGDFFKLFGLPEARETLARIFNDQPAPAPADIQGGGSRLSDFFAGFGQKGPARDRRSPDILVLLQISFKEAALGAEKFVAYNTAGGAVKVPVSIPPAARPGQRLVIRDRGPCPPGGQPGDVVVTLSISPDPHFSRLGADLLTTLELSARELAEGCRPLVTALTGQTLRLTIPPGTTAGATFKLPGYGLPKPDGAKGDLLVRLKT